MIVALTLTAKKNVVTEVAEVAAKAVSAIIVNYRGLTANQMTVLRSEARKLGVYIRVIRNTLARKAFVNTEFNCLDESLVGPVFIALSFDAPGDAAKMLRELLKNFEKLEVKSLAVNGKVYGAQDLEFIASLPTHSEALTQLVCLMQAPITKFVSTLSAPLTKLVRVIVAIKDQKQ